jgi:sulfite reductase beta subunit-like hemoprotein
MLEKLVEISNQRNQKINKIEKIKSNRTVDEAKEILKDTPFYNNLISCAGSDTCSFGAIHGKYDALEKSVKVSKDVDDDIRYMVDKMIDSTKSRAEVFSELLVDFNSLIALNQR